MLMQRPNRARLSSDATSRALGAGLAALLLAPIAFAQDEGALDAVPLDLALARATFAQRDALAAADGGALWGVALDAPLLLVDPESRDCVADRADPAGLLTETDGVWTGRVPDALPVANFAVEWAGVRWTMIVWPPPEDETECARLVMHEAFHNAQRELGFSAAGGGPCPHLATFDGRLWLRLEARALAAAVVPDIEREVPIDTCLTDALLFRAMRRALVPDAAAREDALERHEGSAEYTGLRLAVTSPSQRAVLAGEGLLGLDARPSLERSFAYATGPALGLLLDALRPEWRGDFLAGASLTDLLASTMLFEVPDRATLEARARERAQQWSFAEIAAEEEARAAARLAYQANLRARYVDGPVLILPVVGTSRTFDPNRVEELVDIGTFYGTLWIQGSWGVADAPGGGLILERAAHLAAPSDLDEPELAGDGWTLQLAPGWTVTPGEREGDWRLARATGG